MPMDHGEGRLNRSVSPSLQQPYVDAIVFLTTFFLNQTHGLGICEPFLISEVLASINTTQATGD